MEEVPKNKEEVIAELKLLKTEIYKDDDIYDQLVEFIEKIKAKYPDYMDYELFHLFSASTMREEPKAFDFPGEDSLEKWVRENI